MYDENEESLKPEKKKTRFDYLDDLDDEKFGWGIEVNQKFFERTYQTEWLIPDLIERNKVCVLYGEKGTYKSFIALHIGWLLGNGYSVLGSDVSFVGDYSMHVKYLALEDSEQHNIRLQALNENYPVVAKPREEMTKDDPYVGFSIVKDHFRLDGTDLNLAKIDYLTVIADLLIIDTVSYMYPDGDETKGNIARLVMHELARCAEQNYCTIIALHHPPDGNPNKLRGSSEMANSVNTIIQNKKGKLKVTKQRNGKTGKVVTYKMVPTLDSFTVEFTNSRKDLSQYEKTVLEIVESADGQRISNKELIAQFKERYPDTKSIYSVLDRARERNITLGFLKCDEKDKKITYEIDE